MSGLRQHFWGFGGVFLLSTVFGLMGCTHAGDEPAQIHLQLPSSQALGKISGQSSSARIGLIALNVSGSGMPILRHYWNLREECEKINCDPNINLPTPPTSMVFELKTGERLFQVLIVAETEAEDIFYYGDATKAIRPDTDSVQIALENVATSAQEGSVAGRYMTSAISGPSGTMTMLVHPPNGKAPMEIQETEMVNGWFQTMFMSQISFSYVMKETGLVIFDKKTLADFSSLATPATPHVRKLAFSSYYRDSGNGCDREEGQTLIAGFFGVVPSGAQVCDVGSVSGAYTSPTCSGVLASWPTGTATGGSATCSGGGPKIEVLKAQLGNGMSDLLGIRGPFKVRPIINSGGTHYDYLERKTVAGNHQLDWSFVEGGSSAIHGLDLFSSTDDLESYYGMNGFDCAKLSGHVAQAGATPIAVLTASAVTYTVTSPNAASYYALCPYRVAAGKKTYLADAIITHGGSGSGGGPGNGGGKQLRLTKSSGDHVTEDMCTAVTVSLVDHLGNPAPVEAGGLNVNVKNMTPGFSVFDNGACTLPQAGSFSLAQGVTSFTLWIRGDAPMWSQFGLSAPGFPYLNEEVAVIGPASAAGSEIRFLEMGFSGVKLAEGYCYPVSIRHIAATAPAVDSMDRTYSLSTSGTSAAGTFHSDSGCSSGAVSSAVLASGNHQTILYYKPALSGGTSTSFTVHATSNFNSSASGLIGIASFHEAQIRMHDNNLRFDRELCKTFDVYAVNNVGAQLHNLASPVSLSISASDATLATNCAGSFTGSANLSLGSYGVGALAFKTNPSATSSVITIVPSLGNNSSETLTVWDPALDVQGLVGSPASIYQNVCYEFDVGTYKHTTYPSGTPASNPSASGYNVDIAVSIQSLFYSDSNCMSMVAGPTFVYGNAIAANTSLNTYRFASTENGNQTMTIGLPNYTESQAHISKSLTVAPFAVSLSAETCTVSQCTPIQLIASGLQGGDMARWELGLTAGSGDFFADNTCLGGNLGPSASIMATSANHIIYYKANSGVPGALVMLNQLYVNNRPYVGMPPTAVNISSCAP